MVELSLILVCSPVPIGNGTALHEWGVVVYDGATIRAAGDPFGTCTVEEAVAYAPVISLHGPGFTGDISVAALGTIFEMYPEPDVTGGPGMMTGGLGSFIRWEGVQALPADTGPGFQFPPVEGLDAAPLWRHSENLTLTRPDGFCDRFLYYEVDLSGTGFPLPLAGYAPQGTTPAVGILLFHRSAIGTAGFELLPGGDLSLAGSTAPFLYSAAEVRSVLGRWAGDALTDGELESLWATWEPWVLSGDWEGGSIAVFPLPEQTVELVSTVTAVSDQGNPLPVHRFFLGMMPVP